MLALTGATLALTSLVLEPSDCQQHSSKALCLSIASTFVITRPRHLILMALHLVQEPRKTLLHSRIHKLIVAILGNRWRSVATSPVKRTHAPESLGIASLSMLAGSGMVM